MQTGMANGLSLAAAPTFGFMALLTLARGDALCTAAPAGTPLTGMAAMYLLMTAFHLTPWLKLVQRREQ